MCGITGFFGEVAQTRDAREQLAAMTRALSHRGPDGSGSWLGPEVGLGHTRLAIIDLETGQQPMWDATGRYVVVFNGEIYNHPELRAELSARGYTFRTKSDTEVIPAALDAWGIDEGLKRLRGMFAFAMYDVTKHRLVLARDRVGIKPLYWSLTGKGLLFGSEQKALLASGLVERRVNATAVHDFLAQGYPTTPETCWQDIRLMEPGTWLVVDSGGTRDGRYWEWVPREDTAMELEEATEITRESLQDALKCHLLSDVPIGVFLSGGLDSSLMVALLSDKLAPGMQTFNMGFGDAAYDESNAARQVAEHCGTRHYETRLGNGEADPDTFRRILEIYDEPFGDSSCIPVYLICQEMKKSVKVVLSGDGGDEVLGGYLRYLFARRLAKISRFRSLLPFMSSMITVAEPALGRQSHRVAKAGRLAQLERAEMLCALYECFSEEERVRMYLPDFSQKALLGGSTAGRFRPFLRPKAGDPIQQMIAAEMRLRLHANYLRKVDVASSAHGLEVRVPYLDNEMLQLASKLPVRLKVAPNGETKIISRRLVAQLLPSSTAARPKQGFDLPFDRWLGDETRGFIRDLILDSHSAISGWFHREALERVWSTFEHADGNNGGPQHQRSQRVFLLASLELWLRRWKPSLN
ncbi:MAG: asparagine synthase (glutamine-hydrolyzing) [Pyrinomonadaceae bacterium]